MKKRKSLITASTFPRWSSNTEPRFVHDLSKHTLNEFDVTALAPATPGVRGREILEGGGVKLSDTIISLYTNGKRFVIQKQLSQESGRKRLGHC